MRMSQAKGNMYCIIIINRNGRDGSDSDVKRNSSLVVQFLSIQSKCHAFYSNLMGNGPFGCSTLKYVIFSAFFSTAGIHSRAEFHNQGDTHTNVDNGEQFSRWNLRAFLIPFLRSHLAFCNFFVWSWSCLQCFELAVAVPAIRFEYIFTLSLFNLFGVARTLSLVLVTCANRMRNNFEITYMIVAKVAHR